MERIFLRCSTFYSLLTPVDRIQVQRGGTWMALERERFVLLMLLLCVRQSLCGRVIARHQGIICARRLCALASEFGERRKKAVFIIADSVVLLVSFDHCWLVSKERRKRENICGSCARALTRSLGSLYFLCVYVCLASMRA